MSPRVALACFIALGSLFFVHVYLDYTTALDVVHNSDVIKEHVDLVCRLDELFGLDRPLPPKRLQRLRPSQRKALRDIVAACPQLQQKGK